MGFKRQRIFIEDGLKAGGIYYSADLVRIAGGIFGEGCEFICGDALETPAGTKYDAVMSYGAFMSNYSVGLIDILDLKKKEACEKYRTGTAILCITSS